MRFRVVRNMRKLEGLLGRASFHVVQHHAKKLRKSSTKIKVKTK